MNKNKWITLGIIVMVVILTLVAIKFIPFWLTIINIIVFSLGFCAGYLFKNPKILEKVEEKFGN